MRRFALIVRMIRANQTGTVVFRKAAVTSAAVFAMTVITVKPSAADSSASIALRGIVPPRAVVAFANIAGGAAIELATAVRAGTAMIDLTTMGNSVARVKMSLIASASAQKRTLALTTADGSSIPYQVRFAGEDLQFINGEALLRQASQDGFGTLEFIAPQAATVTKNYSDHLIVVVTAK